MKISPEMVKEVQELYYDVAMDSKKTETRDHLSTLETEDLHKAGIMFDDLIKELGATNKKLANAISNAGVTVSSYAETNGFIKGFLYARALLIG